MKKTILGTIPDMFSIGGNDYSRFLNQGGAEQMMRDVWSGVGRRLNGAMEEVSKVEHGDKPKDQTESRAKTASRATAASRG